MKYPWDDIPREANVTNLSMNDDGFLHSPQGLIALFSTFLNWRSLKFIVHHNDTIYAQTGALSLERREENYSNSSTVLGGSSEVSKCHIWNHIVSHLIIRRPAAYSSAFPSKTSTIILVFPQVRSISCVVTSNHRSITRPKAITHKMKTPLKTDTLLKSARESNWKSHPESR